MKPILLIFLTIALNFHCLQAKEKDKFWKKDYSTADGIAAKASKTKNLEKLSSALTKNLPDTIDKYRAIFTWVAMNITYDCEGLHNPAKCRTDPKDVISRGKSVCQGYANLFKALCELSGLKCLVVDGWSKNTFDKIDKEFTENTDHAWNVITLNNTYYLCDVTWGAGFVKGNCTGFEKSFKGFYFCTPPRIFCLNHYPREEKWLMGEKISKKTFQELPHYFAFPLEYNISDLNQNKGSLTFKKGKKMKFEMKLDKALSTVIVQPSNDKNGTKIEFVQSGNKLTFEYELDKYSPYLFIFFDLQGALVYKVKE
jgi:hypothetical protein